jgi:hypothetical protein
VVGHVLHYWHGPTDAGYSACRPSHPPIYVDQVVANPRTAPCFESSINFTKAYTGVPHRPRLLPAALIGCLPAKFATTRRLVAACLLAPRFITYHACPPSCRSSAVAVHYIILLCSFLLLLLFLFLFAFLPLLLHCPRLDELLFPYLSTSYTCFFTFNTRYANLPPSPGSHGITCVVKPLPCTFISSSA